MATINDLISWVTNDFEGDGVKGLRYKLISGFKAVVWEKQAGTIWDGKISSWDFPASLASHGALILVKTDNTPQGFSQGFSRRCSYSGFQMWGIVAGIFNYIRLKNLKYMLYMRITPCL